MKKYSLATITFSVVVLLDILTKNIIISNILPNEKISVLPFLNIVYVENRGAAFGMFAGLGNNIFIFISLIAIICIIVYLTKVTKKLEIFAFSLILGGAAGNLIDRLTIGKVIDFIDFFVDKWHWPAFNVADSALTVGIILFIISSLKHGHAVKDK